MSDSSCCSRMVSSFFKIGFAHTDERINIEILFIQLLHEVSLKHPVTQYAQWNSTAIPEESRPEKTFAKELYIMFIPTIVCLAFSFFRNLVNAKHSDRSESELLTVLGEFRLSHELIHPDLSVTGPYVTKISSWIVYTQLTQVIVGRQHCTWAEGRGMETVVMVCSQGQTAIWYDEQTELVHLKETEWHSGWTRARCLLLTLRHTESLE